MCEFSDRTKEARPEDFIPDPDRFYYQRAKDRVPLGSIPELPAETCKEIKASEGQLVSGNYWFSGIKPGMPVLAHCDMETEDVDECTASSPVCDGNATCKNSLGSYGCTCNTGFYGDGKFCQDINECSVSPAPCDVNANCQNNVGSYLCSCKAGFTGDGKTCQDIDECTQGSHDCHSSLASCTNTVGSYNCSCNPGYEGDGKTSCVVIPECQIYQSLNSADRKITYHGDWECDRDIGPGWYRFEGAAGTRMATSCTPQDRCNTRATSWLNGQHPTVAEGQVSRQVCFHYGANCCGWTTNIKVRNCGSYYVYHLDGVPACNARYCGTD